MLQHSSKSLAIEEKAITTTKQFVQKISKKCPYTTTTTTTKYVSMLKLLKKAV